MIRFLAILTALLLTLCANAQTRYLARFSGEPPAWVVQRQEGEIAAIGVHVFRGSAQAAEELRKVADFVEEDKRVALSGRISLMPVVPMNDTRHALTIGAPTSRGHKHAYSIPVCLSVLQQSSSIPNDPLYPQQWHLPKVNCPSAWSIVTGGNVTIAILDTGCDPTHPDLVDRYVPGWNFYNNNADTSDIVGHGTATAGTAAASGNNGVGVAGIAWGVRIMPIRISDPSGYGYYSTAAQGLTWAADHGAKVANISYQMTESSTVQSAAQYFQSKGGVVTISAGNGGTLLTTSPSPYIITVGSTGSTDARSSWSNYGGPVTLYAPGESILTTDRGGGYGWWSGTSFSAPIVAGAAALRFCAHPFDTGSMCQWALTHTATTTSQGLPRLDVQASTSAVVMTIADPSPPGTSGGSKGHKGGKK